jgi:hypothetical protein
MGGVKRRLAGSFLSGGLRVEMVWERVADWIPAATWKLFDLMRLACG